MPKLLIIGFGSLAADKGGSIAYQEALLEAVSKRGWQTVYLFSAPFYNLKKGPYLKHWYKNRIKFIALLNSPLRVLSQDNPAQHCYEPQTEKLVQEVLDQEKPDIVHFHELQLLPATIIDSVVKRNIACIKSMHNYYDICPERDLMYKAESLCIDFEKGNRCRECLAILPAGDISFQRKLMRTILPDSLYTAFSDLYMFIKNNFPSRHEKNLQQDKRFTVYDANQYLRRREFFMERLNSLDIVHFSSRRFAEIFIRYGLLKDKVKVIPHSTKNIEAITPKPLRGAQYPVVFGFLGGTWTHKGYQVLIKAFSCLDQNKAKLIVSGIKEMPSLNQNLNVEFREPFRQKELNNLLQQIDVGIVPSVWEEAFGIVGLEFLTAKIPVIASNIGGITEWLKDQENGFLVTPNNIEELTSKMRLFVDNPGLISEIQKKIKPCKTFAQHSLEIISLYEEVILQKKKGTLS